MGINLLKVSTHTAKAVEYSIGSQRLNHSSCVWYRGNSATHLKGLQGHSEPQHNCIELRAAALEETTPKGRVTSAPTAATSMSRHETQPQRKRDVNKSKQAHVTED
jgi:hypothetical protein